jgi:hypothetical protein
MTLGAAILIALIALLIASAPVWPHSRGWGYGPSGAIAIVVLAMTFLLLSGRMSF